MEADQYLSDHFDQQHNIVRIGQCSCEPAVALYATTMDMPVEFRIICHNGTTHTWAQAGLAQPLAYLDPDKPNKPTIKRLFKASFTGWFNNMTAHNALALALEAQGAAQDQNQRQNIKEEQALAILEIPNQPTPPEMYGAFIKQDDSDGDNLEGGSQSGGVQVVLYKEQGPLVAVEKMTNGQMTRYATKKAYQVWHLFTAVLTHPKVLTNLGAALLAWVTGDSKAAWAVLVNFIRVSLPPWVQDNVAEPVLIVLAGLLSNAISHRLIARHYNQGLPGFARLMQEGNLTYKQYATLFITANPDNALVLHGGTQQRRREFAYLMENAHQVTPPNPESARVLRSADADKRRSNGC